MANLYDENNLRVVRLQIVDEITGEPLDYVNVRTNAASVNFSNGEFLEDAFKTLTKSVNTLKVDTTKQRQDFEHHLLTGGHVIPDKIDNAIIKTEWNKTTGVMTFHRYDGTSYEWDTALEKIPITIDFDQTTSEIIFILDGGSETRVNVSKLVDIYGGVETSHTKTTVSKDNQIQVDIKDDGIQKSYLDKEIRDILDDSVRFNEAYEEKIKGIEENANNYSLPTSSDKILGGIKIGKNLNIDENGTVTAGNVLYGESKDTATPVNLFLQVDSIGGPSTDPIPTMDDATSYIVNDANIINFLSTDATYAFITTTDGSVESGLTKEEVEAKFYHGLELINKADISWYNDGIYNYATTDSGDGFVYQKDAWIFVKYINTDEFIDLLNSGVLVEGIWVEPTDPDDGSGGSTGGSETDPENPSGGETGGEESGGSETNPENPSGGGETALAAPTNVSLDNKDEAVLITWTDPDDITLSDETVVSWGGTLVVRKEGSAPTDKTDGIVVVNSTTRNQYSSDGFLDEGLTNGTTYYYGIFPYTTNEVYNYDCTESITPSAIYPSCIVHTDVDAGDGEATVTFTITGTYSSVGLIYKEGSSPTGPDDGIGIDNVTSPYTITGLTNDTTYYVRLRIYNEKGRSSLTSGAVSFTPTSQNSTI